MTKPKDNSFNGFTCVGSLPMAETVENKKEEEREKLELPAHVRTSHPENLPFEALRLCIYLRELEEDKEHK
jgi:hypothetical protein